MSDSEPALASPNGVTPNFANPRDALRTVLIVTQGLCISICSIVIALRLYVRFHFRQQPGYEECEWKEKKKRKTPRKNVLTLLNLKVAKSIFANLSPPKKQTFASLPG